MKKIPGMMLNNDFLCLLFLTIMNCGIHDFLGSLLGEFQNEI